MTSQTGEQITKLQIVPNISRNNDSHALKFGRLIEHNMIYIFLEK